LDIIPAGPGQLPAVEECVGQVPPTLGDLRGAGQVVGREHPQGRGQLILRPLPGDGAGQPVGRVVGGGRRTVGGLAVGRRLRTDARKTIP
jgi:hypothetical protein